MKKILTLLLILVATITTTACDDEWQYYPCTEDGCDNLTGSYAPRGHQNRTDLEIMCEPCHELIWEEQERIHG